MSPDRCAMKPATMLERVDENTIMVVPTPGVTYTGAYESVKEWMAGALDDLRGPRRVSILTFTWMVQVARSWLRFVLLICSSTFVYRASSPSVRRDTSSA